ncbi:MAG: GNAT family N-acetyltransferase [Pseudobdellovibrio sp.]
MVVTQIASAQCIDLRSRILRPHQDISLCHYNEDNLNTTFHLGVLMNDKVVSNGTFIQSAHSSFPEAINPYRLRGMATDHLYQGQALGSKILQSAEIILKSKNCNFLWFNALETAFKFYEKNNYIPFGELFDIPLIGPHKVMYKWLS